MIYKNGGWLRSETTRAVLELVTAVAAAGACLFSAFTLVRTEERFREAREDQTNQFQEVLNRFHTQAEETQRESRRALDESGRQFLQSLNESRLQFELTHLPRLEFAADGLVFFDRTFFPKVRTERVGGPERRETAPALQNVGDGAAIDVALTFRFQTQVTDSLTSAITVSEEVDLSQRNVRSNSEVPLHWIPQIVKDDAEQQIRQLSGEVDLRYDTLLDRHLCGTMPFTIEMDYDNAADGPFVRFHFGEWRGNCSVAVPAASAMLSR